MQLKPVTLQSVIYVFAGSLRWYFQEATPESARIIDVNQKQINCVLKAKKHMEHQMLVYLFFFLLFLASPLPD